MKQGSLFYDPSSERMDIQFGLESYASLGKKRSPFFCASNEPSSRACGVFDSGKQKFQVCIE